jgi:hypothetical protein
MDRVKLGIAADDRIRLGGWRGEARRVEDLATRWVGQLLNRGREISGGW